MYTYNCKHIMLYILISSLNSQAYSRTHYRLKFDSFIKQTNINTRFNEFEFGLFINNSVHLQPNSFFFFSKDDRNFINKMSVHVYILETSSSISGEHQQHLMSQRKKTRTPEETKQREISVSTPVVLH